MKDKLYKMMNWPEIEAIVYGEEGKPQTILGRHNISSYTLFQTFQPSAKSVVLVIEDEKNDEKSKEYTMELADEEGFYAIAILGRIKNSYHYIITDLEGKHHKLYDPYDANIYKDVLDIKKSDADGFVDGGMFNAYKLLGSSVVTAGGHKGILFRVWAPNAIRVSVVGDFNGYNGRNHPMMKDEDSGIFSLFIPGLEAGCKYMYELHVKGGKIYRKLDPYTTLISGGNNVAEAVKSFKWGNETMNKTAKKTDLKKVYASIYETDIREFAGKTGKITENSARTFAADVADKGYTHILCRISSDRLYCTYGNTASTDIKRLVLAMHEAGIGVIMKLNISSFATDAEWLSEYDGTYLYGHMDERKRVNALNGGYYFNYSRPEVKAYLMSAVRYWIEEFHVDGIHIEDLSSMLYHDYGKYDGEWVANIYGGKENLDAIEFIKAMNVMIHKYFPNVITTTKEVSAFPRVTYTVEDGGLGFDYVWNNGLTEDYIKFIKRASDSRDLHLLTDNMSYAYAENYIITISKDDVLEATDYEHIKVDKGATLFDYIPVEDEKKSRVARATLAYMWAHPGKKLICSFQGDDNEIAALNKLYKEQSALYSLDTNPYGFEWVNAIDRGDGVIAFIRKDEYLNHSLLVVCNFSDEDYASYKFGMPYEGKYRMIFNSEDKRFGGKSMVTAKPKETKEEFYDGRPNSLSLKVAAMSVSIYSYTPYTEEELLKIAEQKVIKFKEKLEKEAKEKAKELKGKTDAKK